MKNLKMNTKGCPWAQAYEKAKSGSSNASASTASTATAEQKKAA